MAQRRVQAGARILVTFFAQGKIQQYPHLRLRFLLEMVQRHRLLLMGNLAKMWALLLCRLQRQFLRIALWCFRMQNMMLLQKLISEVGGGHVSP